MSDTKAIQEACKEIPEIPGDVLFNILLRLPVKLILRFRCVSKSWRSLITSPLFVKSHLESSSNVDNDEYGRHRQRVLYVGLTRDCGTSQLQHCSAYSALHSSEAEVTNIPNFNPENDWSPPFDTVILGACNGLICVAWRPPDHRQLFGWDIFLWNPAVRVFYQLPPLQVSKPADCRHLLHSMSYGFGYDEVNDDYKVVAMYLGYDHTARYYMAIVQVYSRKADRWRRIEDDSELEAMGKIRDCPPLEAVFSSGKLYWKFSSGILSLDLSDERYGRIELPRCGDPRWIQYGYKYDVWTVQQLGGLLSVCIKFADLLHVYIMNQDRDQNQRDYSWTHVCTINWRQTSFESRGWPFDLKPVFLSQEDGGILFTSDYFFTAYHPKCNHLTSTHFTPPFYLVLGVGVYVESLVSP